MNSAVICYCRHFIRILSQTAPVIIFFSWNKTFLLMWTYESPVQSKVSKKDDKVDLNDSSTKYTKIYLNSNILSFQFRKVWCFLHWVKLRFYDLFAAESVSQQCWSKWATKLKFCWVFSNQQQNLRAKRTGNFSLGIFFWIRKHRHKKSCKLFLTKNP